MRNSANNGNCEYHDLWTFSACEGSPPCCQCLCQSRSQPCGTQCLWVVHSPVILSVYEWFTQSQWFTTMWYSLSLSKANISIFKVGVQAVAFSNVIVIRMMGLQDYKRRCVYWTSTVESLSLRPEVCTQRFSEWHLRLNKLYFAMLMVEMSFIVPSSINYQIILNCLSVYINFA